MVLLTSSQVSVAVSSGIVCVFTFVLFLSGYVLQQQSVRGIQEALKPRIPPPPSLAEATPLASSLTESRLFGGSPGSKNHIAYQQYSRPEQAGIAIDWRKLAHVQLTQTHHSVCNAIMVFGDLHRLKSPARRVLLFPSAWAAEKQGAKSDMTDPFMDSTRRLLRLAARRYGVELKPISPLIEGKEEGARDVYSLASVYGMTEFDRVLTIETPGLILDASPLDAVLAFTESAPFAMLHDTTEGDGVHPEDLLLMKPSKEVHIALRKRLPTEPTFNDTLLPSAFDERLLLASSSEDDALIRSVSVLHNAGVGFNTTDYLSTAAYIRFSDPKLPGPEYDVPYSDRVKARPKNKDADWVWTKLYGQFALRRMDICGLDLEPWRD